MKFFIDNWTLLLVALTSGGMLIWPLVRGAAAKGVSPDEAVRLINRERAVVVDVREPEEFAAGHVGGSKNVPLAQLGERLAGAVKNKALPLVLVCTTGARANRALAEAQKLGYEKAQALAGGLNAWKVANLPVEKG